jgi:DNA (cytosine-5)-methyltransferase 1
LWYEYLRLITETTPQWVIIENVSALRSRGLEVVLRGLAEVGYDAEWHCIPASALGAPHQRDRLWIIAHPMRFGTQVSAEGEHAAEQVLGGPRSSGGTVSITGDWSVEPCLGGVAYGLPGRVDRVNQLGNAVVPQVVELIGRAIISSS